MRTDDIGAIQRIIDERLPVQLAVGTIYAIQSMTALVSLAGKQVQECTYDRNLSIALGDTVILARPVGSTSWHIITVYNPRFKGVSDIARKDLDEGIGTQNNQAAINPSISVSVNSASLIEIDAISMNFSGRRPCAVVSLLPSGNGSSALISVAIGINSDGPTQYARYLAPTTNQSTINFTWIGTQQLFGNNFIRIYVSTGGIAVTIAITQFAVYEI